MSEQNYRLNSRLSSPEREYLIQTINDTNRGRVLSSVFSEGELIESQEDSLNGANRSEDILQRVKETHEDRKRELEFLIESYKSTVGSESVDQMVGLGQALFYKNLFIEARNLFARSTELDPENHRAWTHLGATHFAMSNWQDACGAFSKAVELKPGFADYHNNLGEAFIAVDSCKRAVIEFEEAVRINVYYGDAYLNLALVYILNAIRREDFTMFSKHTEMTEEMLKKAEVLMPEAIGQDFLEGRKYLENGDLEKAFQRFLAVRERSKVARRQKLESSYLKFMLGSGGVDERLLTRRIKNLKEALVTNPHYADLHHDLGAAYTLLGSFIHKKAVEEYRKALAINPDFDRAKRNLKLAENEIKGFDVLMKAILKG